MKGTVNGLLTHNGTAPISMFATWKRQKTMLEAKKRLNFDAEMLQLAHNKCIMYIGTGSKNGVLGGDKIRRTLI